ncbi:MATE family efflux transporter [Thioclava sp. JE_KL1]|uniref:MATE family efflux transporter n=1 Tax=Thioclava sp. JE_KL1 TaxID=2651187 RepID=UPI00128D49A6|nr:MATE family efflux transporter [Thioclava sp. JE_KL1]MPQ92493.1 MATE family efflux transporter [Thioclava sp. JE_KL1]
MPLARHVRAIFTLGLPLIGSNLAQMLLNVTDTVMVGWYGVEALAALVLGTSYFFSIFMLGNGIALAVMGRVSASLGADDEVQARRDTRMGIWLSILFGLAMLPVFWNSGAVLEMLGQKPEIAALAQDYLRILGFALAPGLAMMVIRSYLSAQERTAVLLWITLGAVLLNAGVNWILIFGNWGAPELGVRGAAIASLSAMVLNLVAQAIYAARAPGLTHIRLFQRFWRPDWEAFWIVAKMGLPVGLTSVAEGSMFQASALMMGWIGTIELAAHGIALQVSSITFMVHVGLSNAATVRAGRAHGKRDPRLLRDGARVVTGLSVGFGLLTVAVFVFAGPWLTRLFLDADNPATPEIVLYGVRFLMVAAIFQLFDLMQVMALGLLRGVQDTRVPMWMAVASYWLIGIPASYFLAFTLDFGGVGLWLGLVLGLASAGAMMMRRFWRGPWLQPRKSVA